jgi:selenocysteine lyase/cysteine desulfurase
VSAASELTLDRRTVLAALAGMGSSLLVDSPRRAYAAPPASVGDAGWSSVKEAFPFEPGYIALNAANLCPTSAPVFQVQIELMRDVNRDPSFENRLRFEEGKEVTRTRLAQLLCCDADEIAITRNTSESNAAVINGLPLGPGDQVIVWDQNHESNLTAWQVAARRRGFTVVVVSTPPQPSRPDELVASFIDALHARTKLLAFSHIANISGVRLPAEALCKLARERGVLTLVDGAQSFGALSLDLHAIGCDFFTASAHKWLAGPRECGVLYARKDALEQVWPSMVTHGWSDERERSARKFDCLGQQDDARIIALARAVDFHDGVGRTRVQERILSLNASLKQKLSDSVAGLELLTPTSAALSAGVTSFTLPNPDVDAVRRFLYDTHRIAAMAAPAGERTLVRFCPHIYTQPDEIDRAVTAVAAIA